MAEMTTALTRCPKCRKPLECKTKGLFGGIIAQMFWNTVVDKAKERPQGLDFKCGNCGHKWTEKTNASK